MIEYVNPAFVVATGYTSQEAIGNTFHILKCDQQSSESYREMWQTILSGAVYRGVIANRKKDGGVLFVEKTITPLRDSDGRITHFVSNDRDITERLTLQSQLEQTQKMDAIGRLASGVAHDFNNLVMVISAYAELMLDSLCVGHPLRRNVAEIRTAASRAADLTRQLLTFSRKQAQSLQLLDLNLTIGQMIGMLPRLIGEDIELVFTPGADLGSVKADAVQIEQVIMNLAANARDAMPGGGKLTIETARVRLEADCLELRREVPAGDYVLLSVTDTGAGIPPEHLPHIFEPFYTTKPEGKGTGLGLATVYGIVKQSGGFIGAYCEAGPTTAFKIYLPRAEQETIGPLAFVERGAPQGFETVLLVEDDAAVLHATQEFLTHSGYTVLAAKDGEDALRVAGDYGGMIDLMISDVVMPQMGGAKLAQLLTRKRPGTKVLFVSGYADNTVLRQGAIDVIHCYLQKPFSLHDLGFKVRQVIENGTGYLMDPTSPMETILAGAWKPVEGESSTADNDLQSKTMSVAAGSS
ncbi:MAG: response regulator [Acidobacteriales bacterium]|nr:response regulator [Terriglobales bacterium]